MITVMGATGQTGGAIARRLLDAGKQVRALGRSETKLDELRRAGAEAIAGDMTDPAFLAGAFTGADAVYTLLPFDPTVTNLEVLTAPGRRGDRPGSTRRRGALRRRTERRGRGPTHQPGVHRQPPRSGTATA